MSVPTPILQYNLSDASVKGLLPSGYTPLAYIESTGTLYIDTGIVFNNLNNVLISGKAIFTDSNALYAVIFGSAGSQTHINVVLRLNSYLYFDYGGNNSTCLYSNIIKNQLFEVYAKVTNSGISTNVNGVTKSLSTAPTVSGTRRNSYLFAYNNGGSVIYQTKSKVYWWRIWIDNILVLDFCPARRDSDGVIGMYDLVSRTFKTNSGSGTFIAGPELAVGKGGGKSLPEEYLLVEYLEGTGTLWINTGYLCNSSNVPTLKYKLDAMATDKGVGNRWWACGIGGGSGITFHVGIGNGSTSTFPFTHGTGVTDRQSGINGSLNTRYKWELDMNNSTYKVWSSDGTILVNQTFTKATPTQSLNLALFRWYSYSGYGYIFGMKIYRVELYNGSTKVVDMFPAYRKSDGVPGMYDVIRNTFYTNAGTGEFILGPSITNCYTYEPNANINHALIPSTYLQVEYLESTGTQRINTTYPYNSTNTTYRVLCKFLMVSAYSTYLGVYGAYVNEASNTFRLLRGGSNTAFLYGANSKAGGGGTSQVVNSIFNVFEVDHTYTQGILKDLTAKNSHTTTLGHTAGTDATSTFYLFDLSAGSTPCATKIYYFKLYDNNKLERYMVPCYRKSDNKPGMYDIIHNVFYINNGSGEFTLGPVVYGEGLYYNISAAYDSVKDWSGYFLQNLGYITIPNQTTLTNGSIAFWAKLSSNKLWLCLSGLTESYYLGATSAGTGNFYHGNCGSSVVCYVDGVLKAAPYGDTNWHFYTFTGVNLSSWTVINLNKYAANSWNFTGNYKNFMIFNTALTAAQVKELYGG